MPLGRSQFFPGLQVLAMWFSISQSSKNRETFTSGLGIYLRWVYPQIIDKFIGAKMIFEDMQGVSSKIGGSKWIYMIQTWKMRNSHDFTAFRPWIVGIFFQEWSKTGSTIASWFHYQKNQQNIVSQILHMVSYNLWFHRSISTMRSLPLLWFR